MKVGDIVMIVGTTELPTIHHGSKGTIEIMNFMNKEGFHKVLVWNEGETFIFHESQLVETCDHMIDRDVCKVCL